VDRLIQQALHQVLQPIFEPTFSEAGYDDQILKPEQGSAARFPQALAEYAVQADCFLLL
jgi:RNA-directed DNA polymerase